MTAPKVTPFEHACGLCGGPVNKVSVQGLIPLSVEEAAELAASIISTICTQTKQHNFYAGFNATGSWHINPDHPVAIAYGKLLDERGK